MVKYIDTLKKKISLTVLIFVLFLTFIEASLRTIAYLNKKVLFSALTIDDSVLDWRLMPNYKDEKKGIYINSLGFRGKEFGKKKEKGVFRIIALGDSCTFGVGAEGTTYPEVLEEKINAINHTKYQVINAGVPGHTSSQTLLYMQHELLNYRPDLILLYTGWNNIWTYKNPAANTAYSPVVRKISRILSKSLSFTLLRNYIVNPLIRSKIPITEKASKKYFVFENEFKEKATIFKKDISEIIQLAKTNNCRVILLTLPTVIRREMKENDMRKFALAPTWTDGYDIFLRMYAQLNEIIKNLGNDQKIEVVDLDLIFRQLPIEDAKVFFSDAVHLNEKGLALIVQYISQKY